MLLYIDSSGGSGGFKRSRPAEALPSPYPSDDDEFEGENEYGNLDHRPGGRRHDLGLHVEGRPQREAAPAAALARKPVPDREGDRHELTLRQCGAGVRTERSFEDHRPLALVVVRDARQITCVVRRDVLAAFAEILKRLRVREI